jgi:hypothetical protein
MFFLLQNTEITIRVAQRTVVMLAIRSQLQRQVLLELQLLLLQVIHQHKVMTKVVIISKGHGDSNKVMVAMVPLVIRHTHSKVYIHFYILV